MRICGSEGWARLRLRREAGVRSVVASTRCALQGGVRLQGGGVQGLRAQGAVHKASVRVALRTMCRGGWRLGQEVGARLRLRREAGARLRLGQEVVQSVPE